MTSDDMTPPDAMTAVVAEHRRLDTVIASQLASVVADTEGAALQLIQRGRALDVASAALLTTLTMDSVGCGSTDPLQDGITATAELSRYVEALPAVMRAVSEGDGSDAHDTHVSDVTRIMRSIQVVQASHERLRAQQRRQFEAITEAHRLMAGEIAELLGEVQFQDVVRQRIERAMSAMESRGEILQQLASVFHEERQQLAMTATALAAVVTDYEALEHRHTFTEASDDHLARIELF